jgi:ribosomal protein L7/L12
LSDFEGPEMLEKTEKQQSEKTKSKAEKRDKFVELAQSRTINAIKAIRIIGKLGNKNAYEYTEADVRKIASALNREVEAMKNRMTSSGTKETVDFTL